MMAELCVGAQAGDAEIGLDAIEETAPSGHFFAAAQTMARYQTEFLEPIVHSYANFGTWTERGAKDASTRAREMWQSTLADPTGPKVNGDRLGAFQTDIARRTQAGGAPPGS